MGTPSIDKISSILDSESILVLMSIRNDSNGMICERSHLPHIEFYRSFDVPLGRFLLDNLLNQRHKCTTCGGTPEVHRYYYAHPNRQLRIEVKHLRARKKLPGKTEGKLWMWSCCGQCNSNCTKRVSISTDASGLSFGKFLEIGFSDHSSFNSPSTYGHSFHKDFKYFFGFGAMVAMLKYSPVVTCSVSLPPQMMEFHSSVRGEFLNKGSENVHLEGILMFLDIEKSLKDIGSRSIKNFSNIELMLKQEISQFESVFSASDQLEMFKEYIAKLKNIVGEERTSYILRESLIAVCIGNNDFIINYFNTPLTQLQYDLPSYTDLIISYSSTFLQELYRLGARRIGVFSVLPFGCLPIIRTIRGGLERKCSDEFNSVAQKFNEKLSNEIASLNAQLPDAGMVYVDIYNPILDIILNPQKYGFEIADRGCCGTGLVELSYLCKIACSNVEDYVFWDSAHPTERGYKILVRGILEKYINDFI